MSKSLTSKLPNTYYWDTSALLTLIFDESGSDSLRKWVNREGALPGYSSFFTQIEIESALFRRMEEGSLGGEMGNVRAALTELHSQVAYVWADSSILTQAKRCAIEYGLRPGDSLQLATALELATELKQILFITLDKKLTKCAQAAGLTVPSRF